MSNYTVLSYNAKDLPETYKSYIYAKWLRSYRIGNSLLKRTIPETYYVNYHTYITNLMAKPDSAIKLAVLADDHDIILGFSASREHMLDYIYVHPDYRKIGVAKMLLPNGITHFTHLTTTGMLIWREKYKKWKFDPFS